MMDRKLNTNEFIIPVKAKQQQTVKGGHLLCFLADFYTFYVTIDYFCSP